MTDYFLPRRLISLLIESLQPKGYVFSRWAQRGEGGENDVVYEFVFTTPGGRQEIASGISRYELENSEHKLTVIAGVLANRIVKRMAQENNPPPSPA